MRIECAYRIFSLADETVIRLRRSFFLRRGQCSIPSPVGVREQRSICMTLHLTT